MYNAGTIEEAHKDIDEAIGSVLLGMHETKGFLKQKR